MTEAKLSQMSAGVKSRNLDQPLKVMPAIGEPLKVVRGYFTQQKYIWGKTPEEMEAIRGIFGATARSTSRTPTSKSTYPVRAHPNGLSLGT